MGVADLRADALAGSQLGRQLLPCLLPHWLILLGMTLGLLESYNRTRYVEELLEKTEDKAPSLTIHLHPEHWVLNNGSKFLYHNQMAVRLQRLVTVASNVSAE